MDYNHFGMIASREQNQSNKTKPHSAHVASCYTKILPEQSHFQLSLEFMIITIFFNLLKLAIMLRVLITDE